MQEIIAAIAALAGILVGVWIRSLSAKREKQQLESRVGELAARCATSRRAAGPSGATRGPMTVDVGSLRQAAA